MRILMNHRIGMDHHVDRYGHWLRSKMLIERYGSLSVQDHLPTTPTGVIPKIDELPMFTDKTVRSILGHGSWDEERVTSWRVSLVLKIKNNRKSDVFVLIYFSGGMTPIRTAVIVQTSAPIRIIKSMSWATWSDLWIRRRCRLKRLQQIMFHNRHMVSRNHHLRWSSFL